ncbi:hypothetical protein NIES3806_09090 [Microcystis aeruginosa NIES-3806]|uniref:Uncharacterized protein n=2 Tax=Microcystis aeruginosa TaxID=1126 RepID=A0A6H9FRE8_MICAE|nr:hypothetical protein NIES3787_14770 [Microcystis aeruginosa NIES-3787]GCL53576.1 hypothetical protein NIES3806_09090 [Microcystis aeruginosa NIES-3806]GCL60073.1 hypothetical protein NIES3807_32520 [Microcystis aeruginosa NIES-3807]
MINVISLDALKLHILIIQKTLNRLFLVPTEGGRRIPTGARSCGDFLCHIFLNQES